MVTLVSRDEDAVEDDASSTWDHGENGLEPLLKPRGSPGHHAHGIGHAAAAAAAAAAERHRSHQRSPNLHPLRSPHPAHSPFPCSRPLVLLLSLLIVLVLTLLAGKQLCLLGLNCSIPAAALVALPHFSSLPAASSPSSSACTPASVAAPASPAFHPLFPVLSGRTLFIIVHSTHDSTYPDNLAYFIRKAVRCWHDADYRFIIQRDNATLLNATDLNAEWRLSLPPLPPNARYVLHENECMDIGSIGWFLHLPPSHPDYLDTGRYRYFFFLNTSSRGPILPPYLEDRMDLDGQVQCAADGSVVGGEGGEDGGRDLLFPWFHVFLGRLSEDVKLVGCTLSCAFAPHIQSYVLALDYISLQVLWQSRGLEVDDILFTPLKERFISHQRGVEHTSTAQIQLRNTPQHPLTLERDLCAWRAQGGLLGTPGNFSMVLACHVDFWDTVFNSEIGVSQAVLKAGFNIAAMELYWRGVDFRLSPPLCSLMHHPEVMANHYQEGVPANRLGSWNGQYTFIDPLQVVFTKYKTSLKYGSEQALQAVLAWEGLHNRTQAWQHTHHDTILPVHRGYPKQTTNTAAAAPLQG